MGFLVPADYFLWHLPQKSKCLQELTPPQGGAKMSANCSIVRRPRYTNKINKQYNCLMTTETNSGNGTKKMTKLKLSGNQVEICGNPITS